MGLVLVPDVELDDDVVPIGTETEGMMGGMGRLGRAARLPPGRADVPLEEVVADGRPRSVPVGAAGAMTDAADTELNVAEPVVYLTEAGIKSGVTGHWSLVARSLYLAMARSRGPLLAAHSSCSLMSKK